MIRVLIADDEKYEREYLTKVISEQYSDVLEIVYAAKDGAELITKSIEYRPDIILMDIRMPRLDGLEAAAQIRQKLPAAQLVILSAYGQFSYAKQAMKLGVRDFLVKPYLDSELTDTLNRLVAEMDVGEKVGISSQNDNMSVLYGDVDRDIVWPLAFRMRSNMTLRKELQLFGVQSGSYKCVVFFHDNILKLGSAGCEIVKHFFKHSSNHVIISCIFRHMVLYIFSDEEIAYSELNQNIRKAREYVVDMSTEPVLCGVSGTYNSIDDAGQAFREAESYIEDYAVQEIHDKCQAAILDAEELCKSEERLNFNIVSRNTEEAGIYEEQVLSIIQRNESDESTRMRDLWHLTMSMIRKMNQRSEKRIPTDTALQIKDMFADAREKETAETVFKRVIESLKLCTSDCVFSGNGMIVRKAKTYLLEHYGEQIGLQTVSDELNVSSGYLSKSFKAQEGSSFTEYLMELRIKKSMELMRETDRSITDIAYEVGFQDPGYFGKCFKKSQKISPSEYVALVK